MAKSARGLFRATGKTAKEELAREENDFYPTPPEPTISFISSEIERIREFDLIWEPAAGD